jgi:hypothetical protein
MSWTQDDINLFREIINADKLYEVELTEEELALIQKISEQRNEQFQYIRRFNTKNPSMLRKRIIDAVKNGEGLAGVFASIAMVEEYTRTGGTKCKSRRNGKSNKSRKGKSRKNRRKSNCRR